MIDDLISQIAFEELAVANPFTSKRRQLLRRFVTYRKWLHEFWTSNSGDWHWLASKPAPVASINRLLWRESVPSMSFFVMLTLSGVISTMGLLAGSTATVIGAMIIAPLMGPIIGVAFAVSVSNRRLMKRGLLTLLFGTLITVLSAVLICQMIGLRSLNEEILMRTEPNLMDLIVAMAAGAAGAFAKSRKHIADAFPGVAIAVALVPPLSVVGIGMALLDQSVWIGASLLYITNLTGIIFSGILVFIWQEYGSAKRAQNGFIVSLLILSIIGIPLAFSLNNLLIQSNTRQRVRYLIREELGFLESAELQSINLHRSDQIIFVDIKVIALPNMITQSQIDNAHRLLENDIGYPVELTVQVIPITEFLRPATR